MSLSNIGGIFNSIQSLENMAMADFNAGFGAIELAQSLNNLATQSLGSQLQSALPQLMGLGMPGFLAQELQQLISQVMQQLTNPSNQAANNYANQQCGIQANNAAQQLVEQIIQALLQYLQSQANGGQGSGGSQGAGSQGASGGQGANGGQGASGSQGAGGSDGAGGSYGSQDWLMALARALGNILDKQAQKLQNMSNSITNNNNPGQVQQLTAAGEEFQMFSTAFGNVLSKIGEGLNSVAQVR